HPFVHVDVDDLRAVLDLLARDVEGRLIVAADDQLLELGRAGDVGPLADVDEAAGDVLLSHDASSKGSSPDNLMATGFFGTSRGGTPATWAAICAMCSGVVPQQPPTMLTRPARAHSSIWAHICSGVSSYWPNSFGSPALG